MAKRVAAVRESRRFDEDDPNVVGLIEPNFSDREHRTLERTRKLADKAFRGLRPIKGNKPSKGNKRYLASNQTNSGRLPSTVRGRRWRD